MASITLDYEQMRSEATNLRSQEEQIRSELTALRAKIAQLVETGFVTQHCLELQRDRPFQLTLRPPGGPAARKDQGHWSGDRGSFRVLGRPIGVLHFGGERQGIPWSTANLA